MESEPPAFDRIWPQVIDAMVLVKPTAVIQWHRKGFRLFWRWRSRRPGRPKIGTEIRDLIRRMSKANPLWGGAPHPRRTAQARHQDQSGHSWAPNALAPQGPLPDLAELPAQPPARHCGDRHVCGHHRNVSAPLYLDRAQPRSQAGRSLRSHLNPTQDWLPGQMTEAFPWDTASRYLLRDRNKSYPAPRRRRASCARPRRA
jgi:putative transposase